MKRLILRRERLRTVDLLATRLVDYLRFLGRFVVKPGTTGAVAPSSRYLVAELTREVGIETGRSIAEETGPGTGVVTERIRSLLPEEATFLSVEKDEHWVRLLGQRYPDLDLVHGDASELHRYADKRGLEPFDAVICGLPFSIFDEPLQRAILGAIQASIAPGGHFTTFAYLQGLKLPTGKRRRAPARGALRDRRGQRRGLEKYAACGRLSRPLSERLGLSIETLTDPPIT